MPLETDCLLLSVMEKPFAWRPGQLRGLGGGEREPRGKEVGKLKRMPGLPPTGRPGIVHSEPRRAAPHGAREVDCAGGAEAGGGENAAAWLPLGDEVRAGRLAF